MCGKCKNESGGLTAYYVSPPDLISYAVMVLLCIIPQHDRTFESIGQLLSLDFKSADRIACAAYA